MNHYKQSKYQSNTEMANTELKKYNQEDINA